MTLENKEKIQFQTINIGLIFFLIFPYVGIWSLNGPGTQPIFFVFYVVYLALSHTSLLLKIFFLVAVLSVFEQLISIVLLGDFLNIRFDLIFLVCLSFTFKHVIRDLNSALENNAYVKGVIFLSLVMNGLMCFLAFLMPPLSSDLNYFFTGIPQYFGVLGVIYFATEPGLSAFGIFTIYVFFLINSTKKNLILDLYIFLTVVFLMLTTLALTSVVLVIFLILFYFSKVKKKYRIILTLLVFGILIFTPNIDDIFSHALSRAEALINISENPGQSPALRLNNIYEVFTDFNEMYISRSSGIHYSVGFVSYLTLLPLTTCLFLVFHVFNLRLSVLPLFIFAAIMLPITNPFFLTLYCISLAQEKR